MLEVIVCQTGSARYSGVEAAVQQAGGVWRTAECFDRCEVCERGLLAKLDGTLMRFSTVDELAGAVREMGAS